MQLPRRGDFDRPVVNVRIINGRRGRALQLSL
jgi:hypothetical protein